MLMVMVMMGGGEESMFSLNNHTAIQFAKYLNTCFASYVNTKHLLNAVSYINKH